MAKRVSINALGEIFGCDGGDHVLISIEDYNRIVRSLNVLTTLVMEHEPKPINNNLIQLLLKHKLPIIEE